ncbi:MAG: MFS transporter [Rhizobiales bacterium]|nr:MFS transporter [Hyphomicrobiales bacterium]
MFKKLTALARSGQFNLALYVPLLLNTIAVQAVISITRVTTSYRAVELDLPVVWIGIISAAFAILPLGLAVWVGRFLDRGHDARACWIGASLLVAACVGFVVWPSASGLFASNAVLGVGQLFMIAGQQMVCIRCAQPNRLEQVFGNYMVANAVGQGLGPYVVGLVGGGATLPPTQPLFMLALVAAALALAFALALRPSRAEREAAKASAPIPVPELLRIPGLYALLVLSVISVTAGDLIVIYLPLMGTERHIDVGDIGMLLAVRAIASIVARLLYARMVALTGRQPLMIASTLAATLAFAALALPAPLIVLALANVVIGFALGLTTTLTLTGTLSLVPAGARGTANSLRLVGNRIGQLVLPIGAGAVATVTGVGGIFALVAVGLAASAVAAHISRPGHPPV